MPSALGTQNHERRMAREDECADGQLASPTSHLHHQPVTPFSHSNLYQLEKPHKSEELQRNNALTTLMNGNTKIFKSLSIGNKFSNYILF